MSCGAGEVYHKGILEIAQTRAGFSLYHSD
jgi:hypothetical protein